MKEHHLILISSLFLIGVVLNLPTPLLVFLAGVSGVAFGTLINKTFLKK